jgi:hypothetical protein
VSVRAASSARPRGGEHSARRARAFESAAAAWAAASHVESARMRDSCLPVLWPACLPACPAACLPRPPATARSQQRAKQRPRSSVATMRGVLFLDASGELRAVFGQVEVAWANRDPLQAHRPAAAFGAGLSLKKHLGAPPDAASPDLFSRLALPSRSLAPSPAAAVVVLSFLLPRASLCDVLTVARSRPNSPSPSRSPHHTLGGTFHFRASRVQSRAPAQIA